MVINLQKLEEDKKVIEHDECIVTIQRLARSEKIKVEGDSLDEEGNLDIAKHSKNKFVASITEVEGLTDENQEPITIEKHARELIFEYGSDEMVTKIMKAINSFTVAEEKKSEELENDSTDTQIG